MKRILSIAVALALLTAASVTVHALGDLPPANTAARHQTCHGLSEMAQRYYTGDYDYASLCALRGAEDVTTGFTAAQNNPLYTALHTLMTETHQFQTTYSGYKSGSLAYFWSRTDAVSGGDTYVMFYSDTPKTDSLALNREHIWPKSRASFYQKGGGADLHHLRPAVDSVNLAKSDHFFGDIRGTYAAGVSDGAVSGDTCWWTVTKDDVFECRDDVKGDVARILLYVYCRWEQPNLYTDVPAAQLPVLDPDDTADSGLRVVESLDTLLRWCAQDPVDDWEMRRNDLTEAVQGNRNVFIDYPELAWQLFSRQTPAGMTTPSVDGCDHVYTEVARQPASCESDGSFTLRCERCGDEYSRRLAHSGHSDTDRDDVCDVCGDALAIPDSLCRADDLRDGDHLLLVHPATRSTFDAESFGKLAVNPRDGVVHAPFDSAVMTVEATDGGFYLRRGGKYLASDESGGGLRWSDAPSACAVWQTEPCGETAQVYLKNGGAVHQGEPQYLQVYGSRFTTYAKSEKPAFRFELYTAAEHAPDADGVCRLCGQSVVTRGDLNGDGRLTIDDATAVQKLVAELLVPTSVTRLAADVNQDGAVTIDDATMIQKLIAELISY